MTPTDITEPQVRCINTLFSKLGLQDVRAELIAGASEGRTESSRELTKNEGIALITYLKGLDPDEAAAERMRRKLIGMAYERAGLGRTASKVAKQQVVDRLNAWCKQYGYLHKGLNQYLKNELPKLVSQFEFVLKDYFEGL